MKFGGRESDLTIPVCGLAIMSSISAITYQLIFCLSGSADCTVDRGESTDHERRDRERDLLGRLFFLYAVSFHLRGSRVYAARRPLLRDPMSVRVSVSLLSAHVLLWCCCLPYVVCELYLL